MQQLALTDITVNSFFMHIEVLRFKPTHDTSLYEVNVKKENTVNPVLEKIRLTYSLYSGETEIIKMDIAASFLLSNGTPSVIDEKLIRQSLFVFNTVILTAWQIKCKEKTNKRFNISVLPLHICEKFVQSIMKKIPIDDASWDVDDDTRSDGTPPPHATPPLD